MGTDTHPSGFPVSCPRCGADEWEARERGVVHAVAEWFRSGQGIHLRTVACRRCGEPASSVAPTVPGPPGRRRSRRLAVWPIRLAPWVYAAAAVLGIGLGVALDTTVDWPWWAVAVGVVMLTWLAFLVPAVARWRWGGPAGLGVHVLEAVSPRRGWRREGELVERSFRRPPFPLYGLPPSWRGPRSTGGWGATMGRVNRMSLVHGSGGDAGTITVETWAGARPEVLPLIRRGALEELAFEGGDAPGRGPLRTAPVTFPVEGNPVPFEVARHGDSWAAVGTVPTAVLVLQAHRFPLEEVELVRVTDTTPYVEGRPPAPPT